MKTLIGLILVVALFSVGAYMVTPVYVVSHNGQEIVTNHSGAVSYAMVYGSTSEKTYRWEVSK